MRKDGVTHELLAALASTSTSTSAAATPPPPPPPPRRWFPGGKIVFVAPTKPLVEQQLKACREKTCIPKVRPATARRPRGRCLCSTARPPRPPRLARPRSPPGGDSAFRSVQPTRTSLPPSALLPAPSPPPHPSLPLRPSGRHRAADRHARPRRRPRRRVGRTAGVLLHAADPGERHRQRHLPQRQVRRRPGESRFPERSLRRLRHSLTASRPFAPRDPSRLRRRC
jgi:hypothetical protein